MGDRVKKGISGSTIKLIAIITMFIDHLAASFVNYHLYSIDTENALNSPSYEVYLAFINANRFEWEMHSLMRNIGRIGFPLFIFLLVEGFTHTRSVLKYARNLLIFAIISEIPFDLALNGGVVLETHHQNVFFTLLLGLLAIWAVDFFKDRTFEKKWLWLYEVLGVLACGAVVAQLFATAMTMDIAAAFWDIASEAHGSLYKGLFGMGVVFTCSFVAALIGMIIYIVKMISLKDRNKRIARGIYTLAIFLAVALAEILRTDYSGWGVITIVLMYTLRAKPVKEMFTGVLSLFIMNFGEYPAFLCILPAKWYNKKRGMDLKYFFYAFYPGHLLILYLLCVISGVI